MAFGILYPRYKASRTFGLTQEELFRVAQRALKDLGWGYRIVWGKEFEARVPTTNWSWHHDFHVTIPSDGLIEAESKSAYQEMLFDFGRNKRNVDRFFAHVEQVMGQRSTLSE